MTALDTAAELVALWPRLPQLTGPAWPGLRARALELIEALGAAPTDLERRRHIVALLRLFTADESVAARLRTAEEQRRGSEDGPDNGMDWATVSRLLTAAPEEQWISARLEGRAPDTALLTGRPYTLVFSVDLLAHPHAFESVRLGLMLAAGVDAADLTVTVHGEPGVVEVRPLRTELTVHRRVPQHLPEPDGRRNGARFEVTFLRVDRPIMMTAEFTLQGSHTSQLMRLTLDPAGRVECLTLLPPAMAGPVTGSSPDLTITAMSFGDKHRLCVSNRVEHSTAELPHSRAELDGLARRARLELAALLPNADAAGSPASVTVSEDAYRTALTAVARSGIVFFRELFRPVDGKDDLRQLGEMVIEALNGAGDGTPVRIRILSDGLSLPWHLLYAAWSYEEDRLTPYRLLGLASRMDLLPYRAGARSRPQYAEGKLTALLAVNSDIDRPGTERPRTLVSGQVDYWRRHIKGGAEVLDTRDQVADALARPQRPDALWYFYCHLENGEDPYADDICMVFTGDLRLRLNAVRIDAPAEVPLPGAPLIVLNACESATLPSVARRGFPPYFLAKGARGVICTDAEVPAEYGAEWAVRFFDRLLAGDCVGTALYTARHELLKKHRNLLGLIYTAHGNSDAALVTRR